MKRFWLPKGKLKMSKSKKTHREIVALELAEAAKGLEALSEAPVEIAEILTEAAEESAVAEESDNNELLEFEATNIFTEEEPASFLPEVTEEEIEAAEDTAALASTESVEGTELEDFESAEIEELEFIEDERLDSIIESILFASDRPVSLASIKVVFKGTNVRTDKIRRALDRLAVELAGSRRGMTLEEVTGGYQVRTKVDNIEFLKRTLKSRSFKLSGPALEVLAIVAYKQPTVKSEIDEIRGVESGHLLRALMEKNLVAFEGKSDLPGKPMQYGTTRKFLEIFGLRNLKELPTLSQIDELLPEGMSEEDDKEKLKLSDITSSLSETIGSSYSDGEEELLKIQDQLQEIDTTSEFFEQEKKRQQEKRDADKAQNIRDAIMMGEEVSNRDRNWLARYDAALMEGKVAEFSAVEQAAVIQEEKLLENEEMQAVEAFESDEDVELASDDRLFDDGEDDRSGEASV
jgi:segregation and condensation protein B